MADIPTPRSYPQILGDLIDGFLSNQGIQNLRVGNPILSILEAAAQSDLRSSQDVFDLLNAISLDKATGLALLRIGADERVPQISEASATGVVDITDTSFVKVATKLFQGRPAPIVGASTIDVVDGASFPNPLTSTVKVFIGRGTSNYEGPVTVSSATDNGDYWTLGLAAATTRYHNVGDEVVLAQGGDRVVSTDTIVQTPQANLSNAVQFKLIYPATIPDGETSIKGVAVVAQRGGVAGNVPANAISQFVTPPFSGASVTNPLPISNGLDTESDDTYRERIKATRKSRTQGTALAITTAVTGITAPDEGSRITSASLVARSGEHPTTLYIDNGTGYEDKSSGIAIETLVVDAIGGEQFFETIKRPITKASLKSENSAPFALATGSNLAVRVGGSVYTHSFDPGDFASLSNASTFEVVASINGNQDLGFTARLADSGARVILTAKADTNEDIQVEVPEFGTNANETFHFPAGTAYSIQLYRNDRLLSKDGRPAVLRSEQFDDWDSFSGPQTLTVAIDGTPPISYTFIDLDFVNSNSGYVQVAKNSVEAWCLVMNAKIPGITATPEGSRVVLTSNAGNQAKSAIEVTGGTLVTLRMFEVARAEGEARDYAIDRNYGQIELESPLDDGDSLSIGSASTRSFLESAFLPTTTLTDPARAWLAVDSAASIVEHGVSTTTSLAVAVKSAHPWGHRLTVTSPTPAFSNVQAGDWLLLWDTDAPASLLGAHRIVEISAGAELVIQRREGAVARTGHRAVALIPVGAGISKVLSCGGHSLISTSPLDPIQTPGTTEAAEIFDPNTQITTKVTSMGTRRAYHTATVLNDGRVLVTGGQNDFAVGTTSTGYTWLVSTELYDPTTDTWTPGPNLAQAVSHHRAIKLNDGRVLVVGGMYQDAAGATQYSDTVSVFNPGSNTFTHLSPGVALATARSRFGVTLLGDGNVMIAGGQNGSGALASVEIFNSVGNVLAAGVTMPSARRDFGIATISANNVLVAGTDVTDSPWPTADTYSVFNGTSWGADTTFPGSQVKFNNNDLIKLHDGTIIAFNTWKRTSFPSARAFAAGVWTVLPSTTLNRDQEYFEHRQHVLLSKLDASYLNHTVSVGGRDNISSLATANVFQYDGNLATSAAWSAPDSAVTPSLILGDKGIAIIRAPGILQEIEIPAAPNYTATSLVTALNSQLTGATASVYRTNRYRIRTNTHATSGSIALVAQDQSAEALELTADDSIVNLTGHVGSVETVTSEFGTPNFNDTWVLGEQTSLDTDAETSIALNERAMSGAYGFVGLKGNWGGFGNFPTGYHERAGDNLNVTGHIASFSQYGNSALLNLREEPIQPWGPLDRLCLASHYAIGPNDDLTVIVDGSPNKRFPIKMYRRLKPGGANYSLTNIFKDSDTTPLNTTLATAFGLGYSFDDFAVYMRSRALLNPSDSTRRILFRYKRFGGDGDGIETRFEPPLGPSQDIDVDTTSRILVRLPSGAERTLPVHANTRLGMAVVDGSANGEGHGELVFLFGFAITSGVRTGNVTTLTLQLPAGVADSGLGFLDRVYVKSQDVNFSNGRYTLDSVGAPSGVGGTQTVTYEEIAADHGATPNIGTVSNDGAGEMLLQGTGTVSTDFVSVSALLNIDSLYRGVFVATTVGQQWVKVKSGSGVIGVGVDDGVVSWIPLDEPGQFKVFQNPGQSASQIVTSINTKAGEPGSKWPITAVSTGTGNGLLTEGTADALADPFAYYTLSDGVNWVSKTTSPVSMAGDYQLTFKTPPGGELSVNSDWVNEEVRLAPITAANVVRWLNTPTVTGLFTAAVIETSSNGTKVQITSRTSGSQGSVQVQGGLANSVVTPVVASDSIGRPLITQDGASGLTAGMWCRIQNQIPLPKTRIITSTTDLVSWTTDGLIEVGTAVYIDSWAASDVRLTWEKQGSFVAIRDPGTLNPFGGEPVGGANFGNTDEGHTIRIVAPAIPSSFGRPVPAQNQGIFRVVKVDDREVIPGSGGTVWIEHPNAVEGTFECNMATYQDKSIMPGDQLIINTTAWGDRNRGTWVVEKVGVETAGSTVEFVNTHKIKVSTTARTPQPVGAQPVLGAEADKIQVIESQPATLVKRITQVLTNNDNPTLVEPVWDTVDQVDRVSVSAGSLISPLDKLSFPTDVSMGLDGYHYSTGLVGEANRVIYGDPNDPATYPGVAAAGAKINIQGPLIRRIQVALNIRVKSGTAQASIADRVRSAVATVVNQAPLGKPVAISAIVAAASRVPGVVAVSVLSPLYTVGKDLIPVQPYEKPLVLNLGDIGISFTGS